MIIFTNVSYPPERAKEIAERFMKASQRGNYMKTKLVLTIFGFMTFLIIAAFTSICNAGLEKGKIYFVGVGPAGPELCTLQAINVIKEADIIYSPNYIKEMFSEYLIGKEVREAWPESSYVFGGKPYTALSGQDLIDYMKMVGAKGVSRKLAHEFKSEIQKGKSVALLVNGDPCIYSDLRWLGPYLKKDDYVVIPGMSSFNAGAALLKKDLSPSGKGFRNAIILYSPLGEEFGARPNTKDLAKHETTMVFFMVGGRIKSLVKKLIKHYSSNTPIAVCYFIGYPEKERVVIGKLDNIVSKIASEPVTDMVLVYVGDFLEPGWPPKIPHSWPLQNPPPI